jgi:phosphate-selective porin OprO and OprP
MNFIKFMSLCIVFFSTSLPPNAFPLDIVADKHEAETTENKISTEEILMGSNFRIKQGEDGVFRLETEDGNFSIRLGGRIHADASFSPDDNFRDANGNDIEANNGTEIRRGRIRFEGTFFKDWLIRSEVEFADINVAIKDMFIQYDGLNFARIRIGEQKQAFSRELQESSNDMLFMERSAMNVLNGPTVNRAVGLNIFGHGQNWTGQVGLYGDTLDSNKRNNFFTDKGWSVNSRITYAPITEKKRVIHFGVAGNYRKPDDASNINDNQLALAYETTHMSNLNLIKIGIADVNNIKMLGLEGSVIMGPFSIGGEYTNSWIDPKGEEPSLNFNGWYAEAAWTLTGESRIYRDGMFHRVIPNKTFSLTKSGLGAWELAARYAEIDLNDDNFKGGKLSNLTIALNWYPNRIVRLMAGYDKALQIKDSLLTNRDGSKVDNLDTFMFRVQLAY